MWQFFSSLLYVLSACLIGHLSIVASSAIHTALEERTLHVRQLRIQPLTFLSLPNLISAWYTGVFMTSYTEFRDTPRFITITATLTGPFVIFVLTAVHIVLYKYVLTHIPLLSLLSEALIRAGIMWSIISCLPLPALPLVQSLTLALSPRAYFAQHRYRHTTPLLALALFAAGLLFPHHLLDWTTFATDAIFTAIYIMS